MDVATIVKTFGAAPAAPIPERDLREFRAEQQVLPSVAGLPRVIRALIVSQPKE